MRTKQKRVVKKDKNDMVMAIGVEALRVKESWNRVLVLVNPSLNTCRIRFRTVVHSMDPSHG